MKNKIIKLKEICYDKIKQLRYELKQRPFIGICNLIFYIILIISILTSLVAWVLFIADKGYATQIDAISNIKIKSLFTIGKMKIYYNVFLFRAIALAGVLFYINICIKYIKEKSLIKRILFIIFLCILIFNIYIIASILMNFESGVYQLLLFIKRTNNIMFMFVISTFVIITIIGPIASLVIMYKSLNEIEEMMKKALKILLIVLILIPLLLLFVQNIFTTLIVGIILALFLLITNFTRNSYIYIFWWSNKNRRN